MFHNSTDFYFVIFYILDKTLLPFDSGQCTVLSGESSPAETIDRVVLISVHDEHSRAKSLVVIKIFFCNHKSSYFEEWCRSRSLSD